MFQAFAHTFTRSNLCSSLGVSPDLQPYPVAKSLALALAGSLFSSKYPTLAFSYNYS